MTGRLLKGKGLYILGLTTMGDAAACLIRNGEMVAAAEEERFSRIKHHLGFPYQAVRYVLGEAGISLRDVAHVGLYWKPWILGRKLQVILQSLLWSPSAFRARFERGLQQVGGHYFQMFTIKKLLKREYGDSDFIFHYLDHHVCHAASTFFVSPFDRAAIFTVDGSGEETTALFAVGDKTRIKVLKRIKLPHSLGQFYSAITNFLGFDMFQGDEWKVMGLAGWGEPEFSDYFLRNVLTPIGRSEFRYHSRLLDHHLAKSYQFSPAFMKIVGPNRKPKEEITGRHQNIAASAQKALETVVLQMLHWLYDQTRERNLCLAGGVVLNSVMNGRIIRKTPFEHFHFQPAAGDAGCALGACYSIWHEILNQPRHYVMDHVYWGPGFSEEACQRALEGSGLSHEKLEEDVLADRVASLLAEGHIVAWYQGRMEWGPRALGNRSFLADPRNADARQKLNEQIKLREWFRPLAPSVLEEESAQVFGTPCSDPFMMTVVPVIAEMKAKIPAVVHIDGTARPHIVRQSINPRYWKLLKRFHAVSGAPCLLNTSFNIQEPIVCTPTDAINTFQRSKVGYLVLERYLVNCSNGKWLFNSNLTSQLCARLEPTP